MDKMHFFQVFELILLEKVHVGMLKIIKKNKKI